MSQLTNKEIAKVFALYQDTEIVNPQGVLISYGLTMQYWYNVSKDQAHNKTWFYDRKLLLTPLDQISDEDAIEVAKIITSPDWRTDGKIPAVHRIDDNILINTQGYKMVRITNGGLLMYKDKDGVDCYTDKAFFAYQYLIEKGYAVPLWFEIDHWANGKTAIELGIAISKNK